MSADGQTSSGVLTCPRLGVHLSLGRSPANSVAEAAEAGVRCIQIFASSPGAWKPPVLQELRLGELGAARQENDVNPLFIHAIYLINLASADEKLVHRSRSSLIAALEAGSALHASGVVTHLGSHGGRGFDAVASQVAGVLSSVLDSTPNTVDLVLENSAGPGGILGSSLEELGKLIRLTGSHPRLKVCLDTAHLCAAGWDFTDQTTAARLVASIAREIGLERVVLLHVNDSKGPCGSRRDRHTIIGEGHIGLSGFRSLLNQPGLRAVPWIMETPDLGLERGVELRFSSLRRLRELVEETLPVQPAHAHKTARRVKEKQ